MFFPVANILTIPCSLAIIWSDVGTAHCQHIILWEQSQKKGGSAMRAKLFAVLNGLEVGATIVLIVVPAIKKAVSVLDTYNAEIGPGGNDED